MSPRPVASISLDLDNQWSYMKTHGDPGWESFPSYLDAFVPLAASAIAILAVLWYPITEESAGRVRAELERRRGAG